MTTLQITAKGQLTLKRELMQQLGVAPGDKVRVEPIAGGGGVTLRPDRQTGSFADLAGRFAGRVEGPVTIEEMNRVIAAGWAGQR